MIHNEKLVIYSCNLLEATYFADLNFLVFLENSMFWIAWSFNSKDSLKTQTFYKKYGTLHMYFLIFRTANPIFIH